MPSAAPCLLPLALLLLLGATLCPAQNASDGDVKFFDFDDWDEVEEGTEYAAMMDRVLQWNAAGNAQDRKPVDRKYQAAIQAQAQNVLRLMTPDNFAPVAMQAAASRKAKGRQQRLKENPSNITAYDLCLNHVEAISLGLTGKTPWAMQMLDAMGKPPPGILIGIQKWLGGWDQCRAVKAYTNVTFTSTFNGKYCTANVNTKGKLIKRFYLGICVPDTCSNANMSNIINDVLKRRERKERVSVSCPLDKGPLDTHATVAIIICATLGVLMVIGTAVDVLYVQKPRKREETFRTSSITTNANSIEVDPRTPLTGKPTAQKTSVEDVGTCVKLLASFSVYTNATKLLSTAQPPGSLTCIHGIRFMSMTWVVLGHSFSSFGSGRDAANRNEYLGKVMNRWTFQALTSAPFSVDSFFMLSGLLVTYLSLKELKKKGKINWFLFYFHRFWRLTPAYMLVIMVVTCLIPYISEGPFWTPRTQNCEDNWWTNLLYVNNVVNSDKMCLGQSWYLANDMQFYILSPLLFVPFFYSKWIGSIVSFLFILGTALAPGIVESKQYWSPATFAQVDTQGHRSTESSFTYYYVKPWHRMGAYVVGLVAGYILYRTECRLRINKWLNLFIWAVMTAVALALVYGLYPSSQGHPMSMGAASLYFAISRQAWAVTLAWVVIACCTGNGGFVNTLLSWPGLVPLSRLTYCIYLVHIALIDIYVQSQRSLIYVSDINLIWFFIGILVMSYMVGFVASLAFEAPMMGLEKIVFHGAHANKGKGK